MTGVHRLAASPIKIMKSRIWEGVRSLCEALGSRMGVNGRPPPRSYRPLPTMGCPTGPRDPIPAIHDIQDTQASPQWIESERESWSSCQRTNIMGF